MKFTAIEPGRLQLKPRHLVIYGLLSVPLAVSGLPLAIYIPTFYSGELGLSLSAVGYVLLLARLGDMIIDPLIGIWSDRTPERWGRRRLWMILGAPLLAITTWMVFAPATQVSFLYALLWITLLYIAWTIVTIPYTAWGAELSGDYHERSRITGWRELFGIFGNFMVTGLPAVLPFLIGIGFTSLQGDNANSLMPLLRLVAILTIVLLMMALAALLIGLPEVRVVHSQISWRDGLKIVWRNGPFKQLILVNVLNGIGWMVLGTLFVPYVLYVLEADIAATGWLLLFYYFFGIVGTPLLARGGNLLGKHRMWAVSILYTCVAFFPAWFLGAGDVAIFAFLLCFTGLTIANGGILGASMSADVIDIDTLSSGEQRGALFMALWALAGKFAAALGAGIALPLLEFSGFRITPEGVEGLAALSFLYVAFPILCWLVAAAVIWNYPITAERHAEIRDQMARRASGETEVRVVGER